MKEHSFTGPFQGFAGQIPAAKQERAGFARRKRTVSSVTDFRMEI
jgi:hypothetical protein